MSRRSNGDAADGNGTSTSNASGGLVNNPLVLSSSASVNDENQKKDDLGPLQPTSEESASSAIISQSSHDCNSREEESTAILLYSRRPLDVDDDDPVTSSSATFLDDASPLQSSQISTTSSASTSQLTKATMDTSGGATLFPARNDRDEALFSGNNPFLATSQQQPHRKRQHSQYNGDAETLESTVDDGRGGESPDCFNPFTSSSSVQALTTGITSTTSDGRNDTSNHKALIQDDTEGTDQEVPLANHGGSNNNNITWEPQDTQSVCEFTHTIADYSQKRDSGCKKAEYSDITVDDRGNKWRLIVYVNGNGRASNHHLSLFLQVADADDLPFGWKKAVSYVLTLEHPNGGNLSYAKRNPDKTFKLCPKAIDWGWSQFITSDRIQQEGFVQNDALVVRASVTVKSSSVTIDVEDAELYLKCAVEEGKPEAVQLCLDQGASVNCQFKDDLYTPLHTACSTSPLEQEDVDGESPKNNISTVATIEGSMKVLELLLLKGADGNACNKWKETPLLIAANNGHKAAVEALLKHGADPSLCSEAGWSALTFAAHKGYDEIVELLLEAGAEVNCRVTEDASTPIHKACAGSKAGHLNAVKLLLEGDADVHALNKWRETPLLTAANHGQAGAVEALLRAGADPCKCTDTGWSPLSIAAYKGHDDVVKLLLEEGAPTEEADPTLSALLQAATKGLPDTVELLLRHGADHTVTTKKGDTALSILVEQNLIDAAVEMVTDYKASIPRCSRDRKKVQRARLLINLRIKQQERDGVHFGSDDEDIDYIDGPDSDGEKAAVSLDSNETTGSGKARKKKVLAEEQAKAAEEALLMELEQEDAERSKQEQEANKKSAKKRKKKERERQLKREQEEKRLAEEKAKDEKLKKEQEAREAAERVEREREAAARKKAEHEYRKKQDEAVIKQHKEEERRKKVKKEKEDEQRRKVQQKTKHGDSTVKNGKSSPSDTKIQKGWGSATVKGRQSPSIKAPNNVQQVVIREKSSMLQGNTAPAPGKRRGWESIPSSANAKTSSPRDGGTPLTAHSGSATKKLERVNNVYSAPGGVDISSLGSSSTRTSPKKAVGSLDSRIPCTIPSTFSASSGLNSPDNYWLSEPPAVSILRREKVSELLHRCSVARMSNDPLSYVDDGVLRRVIFRWIVRAAHDGADVIDFIIPSWEDLEKLSTFFQRQFISEARKATTKNTAPSIEILKDAGATVASLCHTMAKSVFDFRRQLEQQISGSWNDVSVGMSASEVTQSLESPSVVIDWAKRSQILLPSFVVTKLVDTSRASRARLLSYMFSSKVCYDTIQLLIGGTSLDRQLLPATKSKVSLHLSIGAEAWADPFSTLSGNKFWSRFPYIDQLFGGLPPFGTTEGTEDFLFNQGCSVLVVVPPDNMLAAKYIRHIFDILQTGSAVPLSFAVFLGADCFVDRSASISMEDLYTLDSRLRGRVDFLSHVENLQPGEHYYYSEKFGVAKPCASASLFVLMQNIMGKRKYHLSNLAASEILSSMKQDTPRHRQTTFDVGLKHSDSTTLSSSSDPIFTQNPSYMETPVSIPASPIHQPSIGMSFGAIGRSAKSVSSSFASHPSPTGQRRPAPRRGRLFDLVDDDGEDDNMNDVVSDMLGTLNVDLFQNTVVQDVDIEAISLMGIGGTSSSGPHNTIQHRGTSSQQGHLA